METNKKTSKSGKNKKIAIGILAIIAIIGIVSAATYQPTVPAPSYIQQEKAQQAQQAMQNYKSSSSSESGLLPNPPFDNTKPPIKVGDGDKIVWCDVFGFEPDAVLANFGTLYYRYQGADSCQEVQQWQIKMRASQGGGGQSVGGNFPGSPPPNPDGGIFWRHRTWWRNS